MSSPLLVLRKPTGTIQLSNPFSLGERKLLNVLMYHAQLSGRSLGEEHDIAIEEVQEALGWTRSKNVDKLKEYLRALLRTVIEWNEFGEDRKVDWQACQFLSSGTIRGKRLRYLINPKIAEELRNPALYAKVQLLVQGKLSKRHSLVLYEYFQDALGRRLNVERVSIELVITLLGLSGETYRQFKYLQRDVLRPSIKEINAYTDLTVEYTPVREGRQTVALDFTISRDPSFQLAFDLGAPPALRGGEDAGGEDEADDDGTAALVERLTGHGMPSTTAAELCERHPHARILAQVELLESQLGEGKGIENPGAWLRTAIRQNWAVTRAGQGTGGARGTRGAPSDGTSRGRAVPSARDEEAFQAFRYKEARRAFAERTKTFRTRRRNAFVAAMEAEGNTVVLNALRKEGWDNPMVSGCFFGHGELMRDLLPEKHQRDLEAYLAWRASAAATESAPC